MDGEGRLSRGWSLPFTAALLIAARVACANEPLVGKVVAIQDGDTLTLLDPESRQHRIRLSGVDAPEKGQPFGQVSKEHLSILCFGKLVSARCPKIDHYGREVC